MNPQEQPHRRRNALTGEWVLVSPHRAKRPWQGQVDEPQGDVLPEYDPGCYLCPGNSRAGGATNPAYSGTYVFDNDFAALLDRPGESTSSDDLFQAVPERGICRVMCFSPRHDLTLALMDSVGVRSVVDTWVEQYEDLAERPHIGYVQIFENRGAMMGCSNPHPHCQIWSTESVPDAPARESEQQSAYWSKHARALLDDYLARELDAADRIVDSNGSFVTLVPYWALWPFETLVLPRRPIQSIEQLAAAERDDLGEILQALAVRYDNLFSTSFPYSMGFHGAPCDGEPHPEWRFHAHFYPPLLRSASVKKFMVGFEMLGMPQRDITAEGAAGRLRELSERHYLLG